MAQFPGRPVLVRQRRAKSRRLLCITHLAQPGRDRQAVKTGEEFPDPPQVAFLKRVDRLPLRTLDESGHQETTRGLAHP
jgi:hypothetical protein